MVADLARWKPLSGDEGEIIHNCQYQEQTHFLQLGPEPSPSMEQTVCFADDLNNLLPHTTLL